MSADNGIYILETHRDTMIQSEWVKENGYEYRVAYLQAIENVSFDKSAPEPIQHAGKYYSVHAFRPEDKKHVAYQNAYRYRYNSKNPDVLIANAREMWKGCKVFTDKSSALLYASELEERIVKDIGFAPEYGISFIRIARVF